LPGHIAQLATQAKSFRDNPVLGSPAPSRRRLHVLRRRFAARRRARLLPAEDRDAFLRDGFPVQPDFLQPGAFAALRHRGRAAGPADRRGLLPHRRDGDRAARLSAAGGGA
jgi:hypothetical protein